MAVKILWLGDVHLVELADGHTAAAPDVLRRLAALGHVALTAGQVDRRLPRALHAGRAGADGLLSEVVVARPQ